MAECNYNPMKDYVAILVSKKRCIIKDNKIFIKKGVSKKNAIIKLRGWLIPKEINSKIYHSLFVKEKDVESIPFYN